MGRQLTQTEAFLDFNLLMKKLYCPLRIDPFGGLMDLELIRSEIGCDIFNIAIDIFDTKGIKKGIFFDIEYTNKKRLQLFVNDTKICTISTINDIYNFNDSSLTATAKLFCSLLFSLFSRSTARNSIPEDGLFKNILYGINIRVKNSIPISSGLGSSGAFCAGLYEILYKYFLSFKLLPPADKYKELGWKCVYESEVLLSKNEAGFQDQVASFYGGVNHLYSDPNILNNHIFRERINIKGSTFFENLRDNAVLIYSPRIKSSSDTLIEIKKFICSNKKEFYKFMTTVKQRQENFYRFLASSKEDTSKTYIEFAKCVKDCWNDQSLVLSKVASPLVSFIATQNFPLLGYRECGAGSGGCILLLFPHNSKHKDIMTVFEKCKLFQNNIILFKFVPNMKGLTYTK